MTEEPNVDLSDLPDEGGVQIEAEMADDPGSYPLGTPDGSISPFMLFVLGVSAGYFLGTITTLLVL